MKDPVHRSVGDKLIGLGMGPNFKNNLGGLSNIGHDKLQDKSHNEVWEGHRA